MTSCSVYGCGNTNDSPNPDSSIQYYPFPKNVLSEQWVEACGWQDNPIDLDTAHVCSVHFEDDAYDTKLEIIDFNMHYTKTLKSDAIPTLYLPQTHIIIKDNPIDLGNLKDVVVYTITPSEDDNGITTITLQKGNVVEEQLLQQEPSSSVVAAKTKEAKPQKEKATDMKYCHVRSYLDLYVVQAHNKSLKRKIELAEKEVAELERTFSQKEEACYNIEAKCEEVATKIVNRNMHTQQEQKAILQKVFSESQIKILLGKKKVAWSNDDMAVGYTIRHLSNKRCYTYLSKTLNIPLPAVSSIKRWVTTKPAKKLETKKRGKNVAVTK